MRKGRRQFVLLFLLTLLFSFWPFSGGDTAEAASYSPYDVNKSSIESKAIKGGKNQEWESAKKLTYDVYEEKDGKNGWSVKEKDFGNGKKKYLTFEGWSALIGFTHHSSTNQDTYIYLTNGDTEETKMYKAEQLGYDATKDMEYNRQSDDPDTIYNLAPKGTYNVNNSKYNLLYRDVGFRAYIPLEEMFGGAVDQDWSVQIVKQVGSRYVYDDLYLPFQFDNLPFQNGELQLTSGVDADNLRMLGTYVIRRDYARQSGVSGWNQGYFGNNRLYTAIKSDQKSTALWYAVKAPEDNYATRWAASSYWMSSGERAILKYAVDYDTLTIKHVDADSGKVLKKDTQTIALSDTYHIAPENKGTFTESNGASYVPVSSAKSGTMERGGKSVTLKYEIPEVNIDVKHVDKDTGKTLKTEEFDQKVGTTFKASPKDKGTLTDSDNAPYQAVSKFVSKKVPETGLNITFEYQVMRSEVTVKHVDEDTGDTLDTETFTRKVNTTFESTAKKKGHFTNENDADYIPSSTSKVSKKVEEDGTVITHKYYIPDSTITVKHVDQDTGKVLGKESSEQQVGTKYEVKPKKRGHFTGEDNNPYMTVSKTTSGVVPEENISIVVNYRLSVPEPETGGEMDGAKNGRDALDGEVDWHLYKNQGRTMLRTSNDFSIEDVHYAQRYVEKTISLPIQRTDNQSNEAFYAHDYKLTMTNIDPEKMDGKKITFTLAYEYTNHYNDVYEPKGYQGDDVFEWEKVGEVPDWSKAQTTDVTETLKATYANDETVRYDVNNRTNEPFDIAKWKAVDGSVRDKEEVFTDNKANKIQTYDTQGFVPFLADGLDLRYEHTAKGSENKANRNTEEQPLPTTVNGYFYAQSVDESLENTFESDASNAKTDVGIPVWVNDYQSSETFDVTGEKEIFLTERQGFTTAVDTSGLSQQQIQKQVKEDYEAFVQEPYNDAILDRVDNGYYLPINGNNSMKPDKTYQDELVLEDVGLNDVTIEVPHKYSFDQYLLGAASDDPKFNEQDETPVDVEYYDSISMTGSEKKKFKEELKNEEDNKLHSFSSVNTANVRAALSSLFD